MKKVFLLSFCFISLSIYADEEIYTVPNDFSTTDFRGKIWFYGTNSIGDEVTTFISNFQRYHVERVIAEGNFAHLQEPYYSICRNILDRGRNKGLPNRIMRIMIICDAQYGVLLWSWNDTVPAVIMGVGPGEKLMSRIFFELKSR